MNRIFIGWDSAQAVAYDVLAWSIRRYATAPVSITPIKLADMEAKGFSRSRDPLASTEFTYTRFLVPWLCGYEGIALFMDSDMLALDDVCELFKLDMQPYALRVVKHDYKPVALLKMGGKMQTVYPRKNWSSLMMMDCAKLKSWTKEAVETASGAWLHRFESIPDAEIGEIPGASWNVLDDGIKLLHYTAGGPWLPGYKDHPYGSVWFSHLNHMKNEEGKMKKITVWNGPVGGNIYRCHRLMLGLKALTIDVEQRPAGEYDGKPVPSVVCGTRYGGERILKECAAAEIDWWNLDNGFFLFDMEKPGTTGRYRLSYRHLQPRWNPNAVVDASRWEVLKIAVAPWQPNPDGHILLCPPTWGLEAFYDIKEADWIAQTTEALPSPLRDRVRVRRKGDEGRAADAIKGACCVIVHSSKVAVEALVMGVPAVATEGLLSQWGMKLADVGQADLTTVDRLQLFHYAAWCEFTLDELQSGAGWHEVMRIQGPPGLEESYRMTAGGGPCGITEKNPNLNKGSVHACPSCHQMLKPGTCAATPERRHCRQCCVNKQTWRPKPLERMR